MKGFKFIIALVCSAIFISSGDAARPCNARRFNQDSVVCVCDESYCDNLDPIRRTPAGLVQIFESDRGGRRLNNREQWFNQPTEPIGYNWNVTIEKFRTYQEIIGFGGSFSDASGIGIGSMSPELQRSILSEYFSETGIEYSVARSVISGCDFSNRPYSYGDTDQDDWDLTAWRLVEEDTAYKIPQMRLAQELAPRQLKYLGSSWSPPAWMKTNRQLQGAGTLRDGPGSRIWQTYANYLLKYFDTYKENGINFWGMTVQNEPGTGFEEWFPWNTCGFSPQMERDFVKTDLGPIFERAGYTRDNFNILVLDHNRNMIDAWADIILSDQEAASFVKGIGVHWYGNDGAPPETYDGVHNRHPNHFMLATEACNRGEDNDKVALGRWSLAEEYAHDIIIDLTHWVSGWVDWNMALNMEGGPNWVGNFHSAPIIVNPGAREYYKNTQFYAMAHFSKFLPPGSKRIGTVPELVQNAQLEMAAFQRPDGGIVNVIINSWDDTNFFRITDPDVGELQIRIEPRSFTTLLYWQD